MKSYIKVLLLINSLSLIYGCECYPVSKGIVVDEVTHEPVENAQIQFGASNAVSNELGKFEISGSGCNLELIVKKINYKTFAAKISGKDSKINVEISNQSENEELNKPQYLNSDSTSYIVSKPHYTNSTHFEYFGNRDSIKIYLTSVDK